jgi:hypothetical protein
LTIQEIDHIGSRFHVVAVSPDLCDPPVQTFQAFEVILANAREARAVPGRKNDVNDAQWLQRLHACGLLRASFRPGRDTDELRAYLRSREKHSDYALYDFYQQCIDECDVDIERTIARLNAAQPIPERPLPKAKHRNKLPSDPNFDVRTAIYQLAGTDLTQIHGIGPFLALRLIGECGTDLSKWCTAKHFTSWLTPPRYTQLDNKPISRSVLSV